MKKILFPAALGAALALSGCHKPQAKVKDDQPLPAAAATPTKTDFAASRDLTPGERLETAHFAWNSATLDDDAKSALKEDAKLLDANPGVTVRIEGHCDERGSTQYNLALGERRAYAVRDYLSGLGVPATRMTTVSYGKERPVDAGHDEAAWAKNRRAELAVTAGGNLLSSSY